MIDFSYDTIFYWFETFNKTLLLDDLILGLKILAATFFLITQYTDLIGSLGKTFDNSKLPFNPSKFVTSLIMVLLLVFYDKFLTLLDSILLGFDPIYSDYDPIGLSLTEEEIKEIDSSSDVWSKLSEAADYVTTVIVNPIQIILSLLEGVSWIIDKAIYGVFLIERFFFLSLLKVFGAIAITLAVFEKFRDIFYKWLKLYIAYYLLIIPLFLIMALGTFIFSEIEQSGSIDHKLIAPQVKTVVLVILIWLKLRLYRKSYDLIHKIMA